MQAARSRLPEAPPAPEATQARSRWPAVLLLSAGAGLLAGGLAALALLPRPALTPDSVAYLGAALNLISGNGLTLSLTPLAREGATMPFASWPPLYPAVLAGATALAADPIEAARIVQIACAALLMVPIGLLAYRTSGRAGVLPVLLFAAVLRPHLVVSSFVWTEGLFMVLAYGSLAAALEGLREERWRRRRRLPWLLLGVAGLLAGLSMLARYLGLVAIGTGIVAIVVLEDERASGRRTLAKLSAFSLPALLPNLAWLAANRARSGFFFGEDRGASLLEPQGVVLSILRTLWGDAVTPPILAGAPATLALGTAGLACLALLLWFGLRSFGPETVGGHPDRKRGANLLAIFVFLYLLALVVLSLLVRYDPINTRLLAPVYPALLLLGALLIRPVLQRPAVARRVVVAAAAVLWSLQAAAAIRYLDAPRESRDLTAPYWRSVVFGDPAWREDPAVQGLLRTAGPWTLVLTNVPDVVALWTDRRVKPLPDRGRADWREAVGDHPGAVVLVHPMHRRVLIGVEEMEQLVVEGTVERLGRIGEGVFYRVAR